MTIQSAIDDIKQKLLASHAVKTVVTDPPARIVSTDLPLAMILARGGAWVPARARTYTIYLFVQPVITQKGVLNTAATPATPGTGGGHVRGHRFLRVGRPGRAGPGAETHLGWADASSSWIMIPEVGERRRSEGGRLVTPTADP